VTDPVLSDIYSLSLHDALPILDKRHGTVTVFQRLSVRYKLESCSWNIVLFKKLFLMPFILNQTDHTRLRIYLYSLLLERFKGVHIYFFNLNGDHVQILTEIQHGIVIRQ